MTLILGLESSCDETAASVVEDGRLVRSNVIATQHELHEEYAGVVPEIASRAHIERILPTINAALQDAGVRLSDLDAIAVANRPGLIGSLLVSVSAAKALAWSIDRPVIGINHVTAHLYAGVLERQPVELPALGLVVSGGHTSLMIVREGFACETIGRTIDDAVGEAYDKAATMLELGYPGGPHVDRLAAEGDEMAHKLPVSMLGKESLDFSFSGLKTALLYAICGTPTGRGRDVRFEHSAAELNAKQKADYCAAFQRAAITALMKKVVRALDREPSLRTMLVGGGVSANSRLRRELTELAATRELDLRLPAMPYCLDNAAMIAGLAALRLEAGLVDDLTLTAAARR